MARSIIASVGGMGGANRPPDVKTVQELLNQVPEASGGPLVKLVVNGTCGNDTVNAITRFQTRHFGVSMADGRVDPDKPTLMKLNQYDKSPFYSLGGAEVVGTITFVCGNAELTDGRQGGTKQPARVGMAVYPYTTVSGRTDTTTVVIQLTSGHNLIVWSKGEISFGPAL